MSLERTTGRVRFRPGGGRGGDRRGGGAARRTVDADVPEPERSAGPAEGAAGDLPGQAESRHRGEPAAGPAGRAYYWIEEGENEWEPHDRSDYQAVKDGYVSVTPLQLDLTAHASIGLVETLLGTQII